MIRAVCEDFLYYSTCTCLHVCIYAGMLKKRIWRLKSGAAPLEDDHMEMGSTLSQCQVMLSWGLLSSPCKLCVVKLLSGLITSVILSSCVYMYMFFFPVKAAFLLCVCVCFCCVCLFVFVVCVCLFLFCVCACANSNRVYFLQWELSCFQSRRSVSRKPVAGGTH